MCVQMSKKVDKQTKYVIKWTNNIKLHMKKIKQHLQSICSADCLQKTEVTKNDRNKTDFMQNGKHISAERKKRSRSGGHR